MKNLFYIFLFVLVEPIFLRYEDIIDSHKLIFTAA